MNKRLWIGLSLVLAVAVTLTGCGQKPLTKAEQAALEAQVAKDKQELEEKQILSDFQNKAYKIYPINGLAELEKAVQSQISKLSTENAVKMLLSYELSLRMALQNDAHYGVVSSGLSQAVGEQKGLIDLVALLAANPGLEAEIAQIEDNGFSVYSDDNGIYRVVNYPKLSQFKPYISDEYSRYLEFMAIETAQPAVRKKLVLVDDATLWQRIVWLDNFFTDYPIPSDDLIRNNLGRVYQDCVKHFIYGDETKPSFDPLTGVVKPERLVAWQSQSFGISSRLHMPFESFKTQLAADQGILTPAVSTQVQQIIRLVSEIVTDHID